MIGLFLVNHENELAFAQFGDRSRIASFRYVRDARFCLAILASGEEVCFTSELAPEIVECLERCHEVLVAHVAADGTAQLEYDVPVASS